MFKAGEIQILKKRQFWRELVYQSAKGAKKGPALRR
jgi:hypothetical protein